MSAMVLRHCSFADLQEVTSAACRTPELRWHVLA